MKKSVISAISSILLFATPVAMAASESKFSERDYRVYMNALSVVVLGQMMTDEGSKMLGSSYFRSKDRICMRLGAIVEAAKELKASADIALQSYQQTAQKVSRERERNLEVAKFTLVASVIAATYCDGAVDGSDDQHTGISTNTKVLTTPEELRGVINEIVKSAKLVEEQAKRLTYGQ